MEQVKHWALGELRNFLDYITEEDRIQLIDQLELSNLLDFTNMSQKKFINSFLERIQNQRHYESQVKTVQQKTNKMAKDEVTGQRVNTNKITKQVRDIRDKDVSKLLVAGRQICYCQASRHNLINNCVACGKIVCEQEGEGPCLFCGALVLKGEMSYSGESKQEDTISIFFYCEHELNEEEEIKYEVALEHKDKLIDFDQNSAQRLGVLDAQSDWYDLANNTWLNKDQRKYALQMQEIEKKRQEEIDSKMSLTIDLQKGTTSLNQEEEDKLFTFGKQVEQTNQFMQMTTGANKRKVGAVYRPFESASASSISGNDESFGYLSTTDLLNDPQKALSSLNTFYFKACALSDEKSQNLYKGLQPDYQKESTNQQEETKQGDKGKGYNPSQAQKPNKKAQVEKEQQEKEELRQKQIEAQAKQRFMMTSLSKRLQTENPFEEFRRAVETAVIDKAVKGTKNIFEGDKDFFKESDDIGMCLSIRKIHSYQI